MATFGLRRLLALVGVPVLLCLTSCAGIRPITGSDGNAYRSGTPSAEDLALARVNYKINSVISLRGYDEEEAKICELLGMNYRALGWSARNNDHAQLDRLRKAFEELPQPYLLHCLSGVDRSGAASAFYRVVILGHPRDEADNELDFFFNGHVKMFGYQAMDEMFDSYENWEQIIPPETFQPTESAENEGDSK